MKTAWLPYTVLRAASLLTPGDQRAEWIKEWRSELWYIPRRREILFSLGAFRDALWLRRNTPNPVARTIVHLESPLRCLAVLATLAAVSIVVAVHLPATHMGPNGPQNARGLAGAFTGMLLFSALLLTGTLSVWRAPANHPALPWWIRLRRSIFLALKIALVQPMMICGFIFQLSIGPLGGFASFGFYAVVILVLRWVITDQQQRCPVCLRSLTAPVRIGNPSRTFLEWYGAESTCSRGHGLLHVSETASSYSRRPQWLRLDDSWSGLFPRSGHHDA